MGVKVNRDEKEYKLHYVCLSCRRSTKRPWTKEIVKCPECAQPMALMGRDFKPPRRSSDQGWREVGDFVEEGRQFWGPG
jgi:DNA-directed RNA polymerase subunit RPC12/RpoP